MESTLTVTQVPLDKLTHLEGNDTLRLLTREKFEDLQRSIDQFGLVEPLVVNKRDGILYIVSGNQRYEAAKGLGLKSFPCHILEITQEQERILAVRMNKSSGEFDNDALAEWIMMIDADDRHLTGYSDDELALLQAGVEDEPVAEEPAKPKVVKFTTEELRTLAKSYHPEYSEVLLGFCGWLDERA